MNKFIHPFLILATFIMHFSMIGQSQQSSSQFTNNEKEVTISGKVIDKSSKEPLEYATIIFVNKNKTTTGGITDASGNFSISIPIGVYDISVEYIAFTPQTIKNKKIFLDENLGVFALEINMEALGEVEIIA